MEIEVNIDPDDVKQAIVSAVINSSLGESIEHIVKREIEGLSQARGAMSKAIEQEIRHIVVGVLRDEYAEKMRDAVRSLLTEAMVDKITSAAFDSFFDKLVE